MSIKLIKEKTKIIEDIVKDIPRNVFIDEHTKVYLSDFGSVEKYSKDMDAVMRINDANSKYRKCSNNDTT